MRPALISFEEAYFERLWGGNRLNTVLQKPTPSETCIGEAWLVADHSTHVSTVASGTWAGRTMGELLEEEGDYLLGSLAAPTTHGRFPLLLKLLDSGDVLSVQVHPDDAAAEALGEPDVGKTEMWHVLESDPGSELICGLDPSISKKAFLAAIADNTVQDSLRSFPAAPGTSAFVAAGTVHAIGGGILLAEIQQNSDLTYRIYDFDRVDSAGNLRELHLEKAAQVTKFGSMHGGAATPLQYCEDRASITLLGACRHFATALIEPTAPYTRYTHGRSFHLLLARDATTSVSAMNQRITLERGSAVLVPAGVAAYTIECDGAVLDYFVPDLMSDIVLPLRAAGHSDEAIVALGGDAASSDIAKALPS